MSDQPTTAPPAAPWPPAADTTAPAPTAPAPTAPAPEPEPDTEPALKVGQLATYIAVDDAGNDQPRHVLVVELFSVDDTEHARVIHLGDPSAVNVDALTSLD